MPFPINKFLSSILLQTQIWIAFRAFLHVLRPSGIYQFVAFESCYPNGKYNRYEKEESSCDCHFLCKDESCRKQRQAVYLISEIDQKLAVIAQFSLAQRTTMLARGCEVHEGDDKQHHGKVRHHHEQTNAQNNGDEFRLEDDFAVDVLQAKGTFHGDGAGLAVCTFSHR